jgi:uncharacterized membrane protein YbhN (UPF0104 family)
VAKAADGRRRRERVEGRFSLDALTGSPKRALLWLAGGAALVVGVVLLVGRTSELDDLLDALEAADYRWLPLCLAGELLSYSGFILAYRDFARVQRGPRLPLRLAAEVVVVGIGATALGSTPGGLAVDYWALHKAGASRRDAARRVLGLNTIKWLSLAVLASAAGIATLLGAGSAPVEMALAWLAVVGGALALAFLLTSGSRGERLSTPPPRPSDGPRDGRLFAHWSRFAVGEAFSDAIGGVLYVRRVYAQPRCHRAGVVGFPLYWCGDMACFWAALHAFGVELDLATLVLAYATGYVATGLPLPVGGSGGVEAAMTFALTACGVPLATALLGVVFYRLFEFWLPLLPAVAVTPRLRRIESELEAVPLSAG